MTAIATATPSRVPITPHPATLDSLPEEGATIGYTGMAHYGEEFADHGYISCPVAVGEQTRHGCYAMTLGPDGAKAGEVFLLLDGSEEGRQQFHGYTITPGLGLSA